MKHIQSFELFEGVKTQAEFQKLSEIIIHHVCQQTTRYYEDLYKNNQGVEFSLFYLKPNPVKLSKLIENKVIKRNDFSKEMMTFLKKGLYVYFGSENKKARGSFDNYDMITVHISNHNIAELKEELGSNVNSTTIYRVVERMLEKHSDTLVHELQHAWDNWVSKGKYLDKNFYPANLKLDTESDPTDYYKLSHEINARYAQVVYKLKTQGLKVKNTFGDGYHTLHTMSWENLLRAFKDNFLGWDLIQPKQKERLIKRLASEYSEIVKNEKPSNDITEIIKNKEKEFEAQGAEIILHYIDDLNQIRIYRFEAKDEKQEREIMEELVRIAETYRKVITLSPSKGYTGLVLKTFVPMLKELGFVGNGGKFGTKKDYKFMDNMIRKPKRQYREIKVVA